MFSFNVEFTYEKIQNSQNLSKPGSILNEFHLAGNFVTSRFNKKNHFITAMASLLTDVVRGCEASDPKLLCIVRKKIPRDSSRENAIIYHKSLHSWQGVVDYMSFSSLPIHEPC